MRIHGAIRLVLVFGCAAALTACGDDGPSNNPTDGGVDDGGNDDGGLGSVSCTRDDAMCGNGRVEVGEQCEPPGVGLCDASCQLTSPNTTPDAACDLTGDWMVEKVTVSQALGTVEAFTANRFYYRIVQDGTNVQIADSLACGFTVYSASLQMNLSPRTAEALRCINNQNGRLGTYESDGAGGCNLDFDVAYTIRGLSPKAHWLADDWGLGPSPMTGDGTPTLTPTKPNCTCDQFTCDCDDTGRYDPMTDTPGWADWDKDGEPGVTLNIGSANKWFVAMQDWDLYSGTTTEMANDFDVPVQWSNAQTLLAKVGLLNADQHPDLAANNCVVFRRMASPADRDALTEEALCNMVVSGLSDVDVMTVCE